MYKVGLLQEILLFLQIQHWHLDVNGLSYLAHAASYEMNFASCTAIKSCTAITL